MAKSEKSSNKSRKNGAGGSSDLEVYTILAGVIALLSAIGFVCRDSVADGYRHLGLEMQWLWTRILQYVSFLRSLFSRFFYGLSVSQTGDDRYTLYTWTTFWIITVYYHAGGALLTALDLTAPNFLTKYKIQPDAFSEAFTADKLPKLMRLVLLNSLGTTVVCVYAAFSIFDWRGIPDVRQLPSLATAVVHLAGFSVIEEIGFFYGHWLLHHKAVRVIKRKY